jgi:hypothetical protein
MTDQQVYEEFVKRVRDGECAATVASWLEDVSCDKELMGDFEFMCRQQIDTWKPWAHEGGLFQIADAHGLKYTEPAIDMCGIMIRKAIEESDRERLEKRR